MESKILAWCKLSSLALGLLSLAILYDEWAGYEPSMDVVIQHQAEMNSSGEIGYGIACGSSIQPTWISVDSASYFRIQDRDSICLYSTRLRKRVRGFLDERNSAYDQRFDPEAWTLTPLPEVWIIALLMFVLSCAVWVVQDFSIRVGLWFFATALSVYIWWISAA